ncbi:MAG: YebC/PmpR family DNA-binding transcriptional regulator [Bryobacterales bacterium]|nr:YebC/PmpR family DNA-binding transcriptional regulator [Bryobacterales bacterium]
MSGHNKWSTIKHKKAAADSKRGKIFTRLIKEITIAARSGGDPDSNAHLRTAISAAKAVSMPAENIKRAILRGTGELEGGEIDEITFEGYTPGGAAVMVEVATDNRNRTVSEIRHMFSKNGGNLGEVGSVAWMFDRRSQVFVNASLIAEDDLMELVLEVGAEDVRADGESFEVLSPVDCHAAVTEALEKAGITTESSQIAMIPKNTIELAGKDASATMKMMELLEDHDDVQNVYSNFDIDDAEMERLSS